MHQKERNSNFSALYFVIYESTNVHKLEVVDLKIYFDITFEMYYSFHFDACDVQNSLVVKPKRELMSAELLKKIQ